MLKKIFAAGWRQPILRLLGRIHCGLLAGIAFGALFDLLHGFGLAVSTAQIAFLRGLLFAIPAALSSYAAKRLRALWQYLLASLGLCALGWLLLGHIGGALLTGLLCVLRARARLAEEEDGPVQSLFDFPSFPGLGLFALCFVLSAAIGLPALQRLSVIAGVLYLLVCLLYKGIAGVDRYLVLNRDMRNLPAKRIQRIAGTAVAAGVLLTAILLLPPALASSGQIRWELPDRQPRQSQAEWEGTQGQTGETFTQADFLAAISEEPPWQIPQFVTNALLAAIGIALLAGAAAALRRLFQDFQHSYTDSRDLVQFISKEDSDSAQSAHTKRKRPSFWDRSPNAIIRRKYRKTVLRAAKDTPKPWMTPEELEQWAGIDQKVLHGLYEKARYSEAGCTQEDARQIR